MTLFLLHLKKRSSWILSVSFYACQEVKGLYSTSKREKRILSYNAKRQEEANDFQKYEDSSEPRQSLTVRLDITLCWLHKKEKQHVFSLPNEEIGSSSVFHYRLAPVSSPGVQPSLALTQILQPTSTAHKGRNHETPESNFLTDPKSRPHHQKPCMASDLRTDHYRVNRNTVLYAQLTWSCFAENAHR